MKSESVLEIAVDIAFTQAQQDILRQHQQAVASIEERLDALKKELVLLYKTEDTNVDSK